MLRGLCICDARYGEGYTRATDRISDSVRAHWWIQVKKGSRKSMILKRAAEPEIGATEAESEHEISAREGHSFDGLIKTIVAILLYPRRGSSAKQDSR